MNSQINVDRLLTSGTESIFSQSLFELCQQVSKLLYRTKLQMIPENKLMQWPANMTSK